MTEPLTGLRIVALAFAGGRNLAIAKLAVDYERWGLPRWWRYATGALELAAAMLLAIPEVRTTNFVLSGSILCAAAAVVLCKRDFGHLPPLVVYAVLTASAASRSGPDLREARARPTGARGAPQRPIPFLPT